MPSGACAPDAQASRVHADLRSGLTPVKVAPEECVMMEARGERQCAGASPMRTLILSADGFEEAELLVPYYRLKEEGVAVHVATPDGRPVRGKHGYEVKADLALAQVEPEDYDLLILPGGKAPAALRKEARALAIARDFFARNKPVAAICHGPQILVSAGVLAGRRVTGYKAIAAELREAGAHYVDAEVVVDGPLVTSRQPSDLPAFLRELSKQIKRLSPAAAVPAG